MKKQNKMLSLALGMSLVAAAVAAMPAMANEASTNGLFQANEVAAPQLIAEAEKKCASKEKEAKKCGAKHKKCAAKSKKCAAKAAKKCASKEKKCASKEKKCASKAK